MKATTKNVALLALVSLPLALAASGCSEDAEAARQSLPPIAGARLDAKPEPAAKPVSRTPVPAATNATSDVPVTPAPDEPTDAPAPIEENAAVAEKGEAKEEVATEEEGTILLTFLDLMLDDDTKEDLLDALIYPDEYTEEERAFPPDIARLDGKHVSVTGYMIPMLWNETKVTDFMLVGDLLACCFGGAPEPDEWLSVICKKGYEAEYYPFVPVVVTGTFKIEGIEDDAGYASGAYHMVAESVEKEL